MIVLGIDVASRSGYALFDTDRHESAIRVGTIQATGDTYEAKAIDLGQKVIALLKKHKPDLVAIEQPIRNVMPFAKKKQDLAGDTEEMTINAGSALLINQLTGSVMGVVGGFRMPWMVVPSGTWRKHFLGFARQKGWQRKDWKKAARDKCKQLGISVTNDDQADAVGVAHCAAMSQFAKKLQLEAASC